MKSIHPNFFVIGAPKAGTTSLTEYIRSHPNVFFCPVKEPEYFATDFKKRHVSRQETYLRLYQSANTDQHTAIGEGSTIYLFSKNAVQNILNIYPGAKLIVMLRNPADLVISLHAQQLASGNENIKSFMEAWGAEKERKQGVRIPISCRNPEFLFYSEWGKLGSQLQRVMKIVPSDQLKVIVFDDFIHNTLQIYSDVLDFLDLPYDGRDQFPVIHKRRLPKNKIFPILRQFAMFFWMPFKIKFLNGQGLGPEHFVNRFITKLITVDGKKERPPEELHQFLVDYYTGEVLLLEKLLGREFPDWK